MLLLMAMLIASFARRTFHWSVFLLLLISGCAVIHVNKISIYCYNFVYDILCPCYWLSSAVVKYFVFNNYN